MISSYNLNIFVDQVHEIFKNNKWTYNSYEPKYLILKKENKIVNFDKDIGINYEYSIKNIETDNETEDECLTRILKKHNFFIISLSDIFNLPKGINITIHTKNQIIICRFLGNENMLGDILEFNTNIKSYDECEYVPSKEKIYNNFKDLEKTPGRLKEDL